MDLKFILYQLRDQRQSLDNTIRAIEELVGERGLGLSEPSTSESREFPNQRPKGLICRWCRRSFNSDHWSPVCKSAECRAKEAALKEARKSVRTPPGRRSPAADAQ